MNRRFSRLGAGVVIAALSLQVSGTQAAAIPEELLIAGQPLALQAVLPASLPQQGQVLVAVRLADAPLAIAVGVNAKRTGGTMTLAQRQTYMNNLAAKQNALMAQIGAMGGTEVARVGKAYNALVVNVDAERLPQVAGLAGVAAIRPVTDFEVSLADSVPYVGATQLQNLGLTGAGVKIAILDSGIDYTHRNLGGSGSVADFATASATNGIPVGFFPTAKVIGGYDFVGGTWPNGALAPDQNPIDAGTAAGHGTHVADIAAGASLDGTHKGMAPGAALYAVKVCSSVSTSCSGVAMLNGLDWVIDPNGDLNFNDAPDVINMSLGSAYGQRENPTTEAVSNLVRFGIVAAISAGNSGDRPFIVGSPSNAAEAISVAQTQMPTATAVPLVVTLPASIAGTYANTAMVDWAPIVNGFSGSVTHAGLACDAATTPSLTGQVALIDRGLCSVSIKVANAAAKGAIGVLIANSAAGDAPSFSFGGGSPLVQTLVITQATGTMLKDTLSAGNAVTVSVSNANAIPLAGSMVSTSSRGPGYNFATLKPDIGAPGASVSAIYGTGNGEGSFGGTSGAAPVIAGTAALLLQKFPNATPIEIKSRLMNTAFRAISANPAIRPGVLAPASRIGAGEVRVDKAATVNTGLWDAANPYNVSLSFGNPRIGGIAVLQKKVAVKNYASSARTYTITTSFRDPADATSGAVVFTAPASITVPANGTTAFVLKMTVDAKKLPAWTFSNGSTEGNGELLDGMEFDGHLLVSDASDSVAVPWHILPHRAANVVASTAVNLGGTGSGSLALTHSGGAEDGSIDVFALTGTSPKQSDYQAPYGSGQPLVDLKAVGVRGVDTGGISAIQFAIATYGERAHPAYPAGFEVDVDANGDGQIDYYIYNAESVGFGVTGQTIVAVQNATTGQTFIRFYAAAELGSSNMVFTVLASDIGLTSLNQPFNFRVYAYDNYFTGNITDVTGLMSFTPAQPRYSLGTDSFTVPMGFAGSMPVSMPAGGTTASPSQTGFLLMHRNGLSGKESTTVSITP